MTPIASVSDLLADGRAADGHQPLRDHLARPRRRRPHRLRRRDRPATTATSPSPYAQASRASSSWTLELVVAPSHRDELTTIGRELLGAARRRGRPPTAAGRVALVGRSSRRRRRRARRGGRARGRDAACCQMRRPLPTDAAADVATRAFVPGPGRGRLARRQQPGLRLAPRAGRLDRRHAAAARAPSRGSTRPGSSSTSATGASPAFCWTKLHHRRTIRALGEIYVIAVDPDFQGLGLGKQLTLAGLDSHRRPRASTVGMLYVDADNTAAVAPVRAPRLHVHRTDRAYTATSAAP